MRRLLIALSMLALLAALPATTFAKKPAAESATPDQQMVDNLSNPLAEAQAERKATAFQQVVNGKISTSGPNKVAEVAKGQFVELARQGEDTIWTVLGDFGDQESPFGVLQGGLPGPQHNQIPEPDRTVDNTTIWAPDFSKDYYENLLFSEAPGAVSMRNFYIEQSSNRYTVNGTVEDWVQVPYREAHYGRNWCGGIVCSTTWWFVQDTLTAWYNQMLSDGMTPAEINDYLSQFDQWDRYDYDNDGNFNEPDGYIDHFQAVHAGEGEETGGGAYGSDAIWSHRWYVQLTPIGAGGPHNFGGVKIGNSDFWVGDYTIEPENGGVGVFSHEFGHDLGLPDLYDTSGNVGGAENSTGFWTLYSSGSYGNTGIPQDGIGSKPISMSAYEKIFLGWDNYEIYGYGQRASTKLGPAVSNTKQAQAVVLLLPDKEVTFPVGDPYSGDWMYFSGSGNNLDNSMTRSVTLPAGPVSLAAKVNYDIEVDWDYAYLTVNGTSVATNLSTNTNPNGQNFGEGITGSSGAAWVDLTADLSAFAGQTVTIGFRYWTDVAVANPGFFVDDIAITGQALDDAETDPGWTYDGFIRTESQVELSFFNAYFVEFRNYKGYDDGLRTGPYNFGYTNDPTLANWVDHFPYQDGLLVWYYDTSFEDNNVGAHCAGGRCGGMYLPVDAHPELLLRPDNGQVWRPRIQSFDSTFGLGMTDEIVIHQNSVSQTIPSRPAVATFNDMNDYWVAPDASISNFGWSSVQVPHTGTSITVKSISAQGNFMQVLINQ